MTSSNNEQAVLKLNKSINVWGGETEKKLKWAIYLSDDSFFGGYPTIKLAEQDAKKYKLNIKRG